MSNFQVNVPASMRQAWQQATSDKVIDQRDLQNFRQIAASTQGSPLQEALEGQLITKIEAQLQAHSGHLLLDTMTINENAGHATASIQIVDRPVTPAFTTASADAVAPRPVAPTPPRPVTPPRPTTVTAPVVTGSGTLAPPASIARPPQPQGFVVPTQAEIDWAMDLEQRVNQPGATPPPAQELRRYEDIMARLLRSKADLPAPSLAELTWAADLGRNIQQKQYKPGPDELRRYQDISLRQLAQVQKELARLPQPTQPPTQQDLSWAQAFHDRVKSGTGPPPTVEDTVRFQRVILAFQKFQTVQR